MSIDHLGSRRTNAFEASEVRIGPNQVRVKAVEWGVLGSAPPDHEFMDDEFSKDEMALHESYWSMLDKKFEAWYAVHKVTPEAAHAATAQAIRAGEAYESIRTEHAKVEADLIQKRNAAEQFAAHLDRMTAAHADLEKAIADKQQAHEALDATLEMKRAAAAVEAAKKTDG